ncbi:DNA polymerase III subunit delta [Spiroplasma turonicum]|nr:DNA polymerase III subunit delta [Spiroplasma turonicum]ALX70736.1 DNA polymerase III subunit delta [Spiroplasma turonicum]
MFLIYSNDDYLLNKQTKKIINKLLENEYYEVLRYSLIDSNINEIYEEINTISLFNEKKIIIIEDCYFLTEKKIKLHQSFDVDIIKKIISQKNINQLIFTLNSETYSKRLKISKEFELSCKILEVKKPSYNEKIALVKRKLTDNKIKFNEDAINYLLEVLPDDMGVFSNEVAKLIEYNSFIDINLVNIITEKYQNFDIFSLVETILDNNIEDFIKKFNIYVNNNKDIYGFLALVLNGLTTLRNINICKKNAMSDNQIIDLLKINPYRLKVFSNKKIKDISLINDKINLLYYLEKNLKSGLFDSKIIPELTFLKIFN